MLAFEKEFCWQPEWDQNAHKALDRAQPRQGTGVVHLFVGEKYCVRDKYDMLNLTFTLHSIIPPAGLQPYTFEIE